MQTFHFAVPILFFVNFVSSTTSTPTISRSRYLSRNLTTAGNLLPISSNSSIFNITEPGDESVRYLVPGTHIVLYMDLGFPIDAPSLGRTLNDAQTYCEWQIDAGSKGILPRQEDPFLVDHGWGAAVSISSANPRRRLTWLLLMEILDGLWEYLIVGKHFMETEFEIGDDESGILIGSGAVDVAPKAIHPDAPDAQQK